MWGHGTYTWLKFSSVLYDGIFGWFLPRRVPYISKFVKKIFGRTSFISASVFHEPDMRFIATPKPRNATSSRRARNNPLGMTLDDSMIEMTEEKCASLTALLQPFKKGAELQKQAKKKFSFTRLLLAVMSRLGITRIIQPQPITFQNVETYTGRGKKRGTRCSMRQVTSYYHFYRGNANVVDGNYVLKGSQNLFISDASILGRLQPGAPSTVIMEQGMKVADAFIGTLEE